jgi:hypothetical protein
MAAKSLKIDSLDLDLENPRIILVTGSRHVVYNIGYGARSASQGSEVMFFCDRLKIPPLIGPIQIAEDHAGLLRRMA